MPLYEYRCESCAHRFERIQKFSDPPVETCPQCSGHVKKLLSSPAIQFKGTGWYVTDYAKKSGSAGGASESSGSGSAESKGESSGESKSEATQSKSESKGESKADSKGETKSGSTKSE
jgi:putative FmdB family regulatory protein